MGHSLEIPQAILRPLEPHVGRGTRRPVEEQNCVVLRLAESVAPDEADFLYRVVSTAIRLNSFLQTTSAVPSGVYHPAEQPMSPLRLLLGQPDLHLSPDGSRYTMRFAGGREMAVPASLVTLEQDPEKGTGTLRKQSGHSYLSFNRASPLTPLLNQLVQTILQLVHHFGPSPKTTYPGGDSSGISPHTSITMKPQTAFNPPLNVPRSIIIEGPGSGTGGGLPHIRGNVVALIEGDTLGVFNVIGLETDALIHQDDAPHGSRTWTFVQSVNGPGPIAIGQAEALLVTVGFGVPRSPGSGPFAATVVIVAEGTTGPPLFEVGISAAA
jgi:hypothetical protein